MQKIYFNNIVFEFLEIFIAFQLASIIVVKVNKIGISFLGLF